MLLAFFFSVLSLIIGLAVLRLYTPLYKSIFAIVLLSWFGHILSTVVISTIHSDSMDNYFAFAEPAFQGLGTQFVYGLVGYIRLLLTGDSFSAIMFLFGIFAFVGSIFWYCLFLRTAQILEIKYAGYYQFPAIILLCWPSFIVFSAGMKDAWSFFFIPLFWLSFFAFKYNSNSKIRAILMMLFAALMAFLVRPYLMVIILGAFFIASQLSVKRRFIFNILLGVILVFVLIILAKYIVPVMAPKFANMDVNYNTVTQTAVLEQRLQAAGTSFPVLTQNPNYILFSLPYSFIMNLFFPLFFLAHNVLGVLQSFENLFLVYVAFLTFRWRKVIFLYTKQVMPLKLLFSFFLAGMILLALLNTNLGGATRVKLMYLPALLIIFCVFYVARKNKIYHLQ